MQKLQLDNKRGYLKKTGIFCLSKKNRYLTGNDPINGTLNEKQKDVPDFRTASPGVQAKLETRTLGAASAKDASIYLAEPMEQRVECQVYLNNPES